MIVERLTMYVYTAWGARYDSFNWRPEWYTFIRMKERELRDRGYHEKKDISYVISFFDQMILQQIGVAKDPTLSVRIRIVCGMINKIPHTILPRPMKIALMDCIWDTYRKFQNAWYNYYCKYILQLPFQAILP